MATYEVTDGTGTYHIDAPDGMAQGDVLNYFKQNKPTDMGAGAAAVQGLNAAIPFGEKITAGLGALGTKAYNTVTNNGDPATLGEIYEGGRADQAATAAANPKSYIGGVAAGVVPSMLLGGAVGDATGLSKVSSLASVAPAAEDASTLAKVGNLGARMAVSSAKAAPIGALYGAGSAEPGEMVEGAVHGAKVGAVIGAATPVVSDVYGAAKDAVANHFDNFLQDITTPRAVGGVRKDLAANATQTGLLNSTTVEPSTYQQQVMKTIADTGVSRLKSDLGNRLTVENALGDEAENLRNNIAGSKVIYTPQDMATRINAASQAALADDPLLIGDGERYLDMAATKMNGLVKANPGTPEGLLDARQQFDQWAKSKSGFGDKDTAFRTAVSTVRSAANQYLGDMVPTAAVKDSLTKQSHMYTTIDALNSKIAYMPASSVARALASPAGKVAKYTAGAAIGGTALHSVANQLSSKGNDE